MLSVYYIGQMIIIIIENKLNNLLSSKICNVEYNPIGWVFYKKLCECLIKISSFIHNFIDSWYYVFVMYSTCVVSVLDFGLVAINVFHIYITEDRWDIGWLLVWEIATHAGTILPIMFEYVTFRKKDIVIIKPSHMLAMYSFCGAYLAWILIGKTLIPHDYPFEWGFNYGWAFDHYFMPYYFCCAILSILLIRVLLANVFGRRNMYISKQKL